MRDRQVALALIEQLRSTLEQLRQVVAAELLAELDPRDPRNKAPDGKLTQRGVEVCYRLFDAGKRRSEVQEEDGYLLLVGTPPLSSLATPRRNPPRGEHVA